MAFSEKELKILQESESPKGDILRIRIVQFGGGDPKLEKRAFHKKPDGMIMGKAQGFHFEDWQFLKEHWDDIDAAFTDFQIKHDSRKKGDGRE
jgi:hypothetical protein